MSRKSKSKDQTKALNILFTLTQGDLLQEALAVTFAKDQTQSLNRCLLPDDISSSRVIRLSLD
jgi:hypothetical protein